MTELTMYLVIRKDLRSICLPGIDDDTFLGKLTVQAGHAFIGSFIQVSKDLQDQYQEGGLTKKVSLEVPDEKALTDLYQKCLDQKAPCHLVTDAGRTVFPGLTTTCMAIGPLNEDQRRKLNTQGYRLYRGSKKPG